MLSIKQAAIKLNKSEQTTRRWVASGKLVGKKQGGRWQIAGEELEKFCSVGCQVAQPATNKIEITDQIIKKIVVGVSENLSGKKKIEEDRKEEIKMKQLENKVEQLENKNEQLQKQIEDISNESLGFKGVFKEAFNLIRKLQAELSEQKQLVREVEEKVAKHQVVTIEQPVQIASSAKQASGATVDEQKAEKWVRKNTHEWLDSACKYGRTWRQLALNEGQKISIKDRLQKPRAGLHIIEKTHDSAWFRMKAKVVLEMFPSEAQYNNHYTHPEEIGGD